VDFKSEPRKFPVTLSRELQQYGLPVWTSDSLLALSCERLHYRIHQYLDDYSFNKSDHSCYGNFRLDCPLRTRHVNLNCESSASPPPHSYLGCAA
jgi:hypothetical protein